MVGPTHTERVAGLQVETSDSPGSPDDYVVFNGHRLVKPYYYDYYCNMRQRWLGQNIIDIFAREFPARGRDYYVQALADGRLRVEGCQVTAEMPLKDGQRMRHFIHRHEPPVPAGTIQASGAVVGQNADMVAVCKLHGMPVHVAGQYRKNTVLGILTAERPDLGPLFPIHRRALDKPVSGLLLFARSAAAAAELCARIEGREVEKVYVARVLGRFPASDGPVVANVPLAWDLVANHATAEPDAAVEAPDESGGAAGAATAAAAGQGQEAAAADGEQGDVPSVAEQPAQAMLQDGQQQQQGGDGQQQDGEQSLARQREERRQRKKAEKQRRRLAKAERQAAAAAAVDAAKRSSKAAAKPALTEFKLLAVAPDGLTSVVECRPRTGRTHQIRVHLQHLGHPIANDSQYGGTYGGPKSSRQIAHQLGIHWSGNAQQAADDDAGGADAEAPDAVGPARSKRARLEAPRGAAPGDAEQQAAVEPEAGAGMAPAGAPGGACEEGSVDAGLLALHAALSSSPEYRAAPELHDPLCTSCPYYAPRDYPVDLRPLWLHARSYSCQGGGWSFDTELPGWARADWVPPAPRGR